MIFLTSSYPTMVLKSSEDLWNNVRDREIFGIGNCVVWESSGKTKTGKISKQGSPWLRWILVQCAMTTVRYDQRGLIE